jgi:hypothetical protein
MLREHEDAYGRAMLDHLEGRRAEEIVERDDGYIYVGAGPPLSSRPTRSGGHTSVNRCGTCADAFSTSDAGRAGRSCTFVSEGSVESGSTTHRLPLRYVGGEALQMSRCGSVTELEGLGPFDTVRLLGGGFGLFGNRPRARRLLRKMHSITSDRGRIIATSRTPYEDPDDRQYTERNLSRGRMGGQFRIRIRYRSCSARLGGITSRSRRTSSEVLSKAPAGN